MAKGSFVLSAILLLFVLAISEIVAAAPKLCEKSSKTFSGKCDNKKCDSKCIEWEKAVHGACHKSEGKDACFCYFDCSKTPPPGKGDLPAKGGSPPPAAGGSPPPADGGAPPPLAAGGAPPPPAAGDAPPPADGGASPPPAAH